MAPLSTLSFSSSDLQEHISPPSRFTVLYQTHLSSLSPNLTCVGSADKNGAEIRRSERFQSPRGRFDAEDVEEGRKLSAFGGVILSVSSLREVSVSSSAVSCASYFHWEVRPIAKKRSVCLGQMKARRPSSKAEVQRLKCRWKKYQLGRERAEWGKG